MGKSALQRLYKMSIKQTFPTQKQLKEKKIIKMTFTRLISKDQITTKILRLTTKHINETNSNMSRMNQKTTIKASPSKQKNWTFPLLLERPKNKSFQPSDLEIVF